MAATRFNWGLEVVFLSLSFRYWLFLLLVGWRCLRGRGPLGRALQRERVALG